ncbi:unnamed protein product [Oppiella nova]|uniref:Uncharacterized protein n=1 Tax=Oppiella nova TaxID=334625 RepID=A0A7R9LPM1_9ACAR|nr:unnamed protein product [Oppiella nova]CAG2165353.1 unnamed protein product [Oppiella nova]
MSHNHTDPVVDTNHKCQHMSNPLAPGSHPSVPINYLDIELNTDFTTTSSCRHLSYITYTAKVQNQWVVAMRYLEEENRAVNALIQFFATHSSNYDTNEFRDNAVKHMADNGFNDCDYKKCLKYFSNALNLYKMTLAKCPNGSMAQTVNPLFDTMDAFVPMFSMNMKYLTELTSLRERFAQKCHRIDSSLTPREEKIMTTKLKANIITESDNNNSSGGDIITHHLNDMMSAPGDSEYNPIDYLRLPVNPDFCSNLSSPRMSYKTILVKTGDLWLRGVAIADTHQMAVNKLLSLLDRHRVNDGLMNEGNWTLVSTQMRRYKRCVDYKSQVCRRLLNNALDLYKKYF